MSSFFTRDQIADLAWGAAFLGAGGGGDPYIGSLLLRQAMLSVDQIRMISVDEVPEDALVIPNGMMGAPTVLIEKLPNGNEAATSLRRLEGVLGKTAYAVMPAEIGGLNALMPLALAAQLGLPVVDADGMGRAFPELQMSTFHVHDQRVAPAAITDENGSTVVIHADSDYEVERLARATVVAMGATCYLCCLPVSGAQLRISAVRGTLSAAIGIGRAVREARSRQVDPFAALIGYLRASPYYSSSYVLFDGKIVDLDRQTSGGFARGAVRIAAQPPQQGNMEILFQNENLVARHDGVVRAIVPDLITVVDRETAAPITTESLRYGQRVKVIGCSAAAVMRSAKALSIFGPHAFGLTDPFTPIEELDQQWASR
jgi:DUF917 family protein